MTDEENAPEQAEFERRFKELVQDLYLANPLSKECRPGLEIRPEGDRLVLIGHRIDNGEAVELARFPTSWVAGKTKG